MRTKALLLTAALSAVGIASASAAVYSVNAVGYVNVSAAAGQFKLIGVPLSQPSGDYHASAVLGTVPDGTQVILFNGAGYDTYVYDAGIPGWDPLDPVLDFGGGFFLSNPNTAVNVTFVGEVAQGNPITTSIPTGYSIKSSKVPQAGGIQTVLGYVPADTDQVIQFNGAGYDTYVYDAGIPGWDPVEPTLAVGEAVYFNLNTAKTWSRVFSVN